MAKSKKTEQKHPKFSQTQTYVYTDDADFDTSDEDHDLMMGEAKDRAEEGSPRYVLTYTLTKVEFVGHHKGSVPVTDVTKEVL
jgi:hypothetical protein